MDHSRSNGSSQGAVADLILASFPGLVVFLLLPLTIYTANQLEFDFEFGALWSVFAPAFTWCAATCLLLFLSPARRSRVCRALFLAGVFLLLCEVVTPVRWGLLDGESRIIESWQSTALQA